MTANLEEIAQENSYWRDVWRETKRIAYIPIAVYWKGLKYREEQQRIAAYLGWQEKTLTLSNAIIFGLGTSALYYWGGEKLHDFLMHSPRLDPMKDYLTFVWNIKDSIVSSASNTLGISAKSLLHGLSTFNLGQTAFRIYHAQKTGHAVPSVSLWGLLANAKHIYRTFSNREKREVLIQNLLKACGGI